MQQQDSEFSFFPSANHWHLMNNTTQALAYDGGDVRQWQRKLGAKLRELTGPMPEKRVPLNVRSLWKREHELGSIEKIVFTSEPYSDVPAFVCLPKNAKPPYNWFICVQGHSTGMHNSIAVDREDNSIPIEIPGDRDFGIGCMSRGIAALCVEQRSFGERREQAPQYNPDQGCHEATMHALILGRTLAGERVFDVDRGIDYLLTRNDVRPDRIGVMGNSGGGTTTLFAAALLPRLTHAMPSCYFCTFRDSIMSIHHCICNYVPNLLLYAEMADVMGLFAPRPVVIVAGKDDPIFPLDGVKKAFADLKKIYAAAGAENNCRLVIGDGAHRFYANDGWPVMQEFLE